MRGREKEREGEREGGGYVREREKGQLCILRVCVFHVILTSIAKIIITMEAQRSALALALSITLDVSSACFGPLEEGLG